jgi:hypothetical protein
MGAGDKSFRRESRVGIRTALLLSLVLHALLLLNWAPDPLLDLRRPSEDDNKDGKPAGSLAVRLAPPTSRHADEAPMIPRAPMMQAPRMTADAHRPSTHPPAPRVLAREQSGAPPTVAEPPRMQGDLAAYIDARRREREPSPASPPSSASQRAETEQERDNRQVAENLGFNRVPVFGTGRMAGGGVFQMASLRNDSAEFLFFGWNKLIRRNAQQMIDVRRGDNATIQLAVVRRMIAIIREQSPTDFVWESLRLRREITLSARPDDNAGLEEFLLKEFFPDYRR